LPGHSSPKVVPVPGTVTVSDCDTMPPLPVQPSENVVLAVKAPVDCEPLTARLPDQPPVAVQLVALVLFHVKVDAPPLATVVGFAVNVSVGAGGVAAINTESEREMEPPGPEQLRLKVLSAVNAPVDCEPLTALAPDHAPAAVQLVTFAPFQVRVDALPPATAVGFAVNVSVGAGGVAAIVTVTEPEAEPPGPEQSRLNVLSTVNPPVDSEPLTALAPDHAPPAVQLVAFALLHVRVDALPPATAVGFAVSVSVGAGGGAVIVIVAEREMEPPSPEQSRVNVLSTVNAPVGCEPLTALAPDHAPEAVQLVTLVPLQVSTDSALLATLAGLAVSVSVGAGGGATPNTVDFSCHPSPPPELILQAEGLPPPTAPKQTPTNPSAGISGLVVQRTLGQAETSFLPAAPLGQ